jgi:hypothetical protein
VLIIYTILTSCKEDEGKDTFWYINNRIMQYFFFKNLYTFNVGSTWQEEFTISVPDGRLHDILLNYYSSAFLFLKQYALFESLR